MSTVQALRPPCCCGLFHNVQCGPSAVEKLGFVKFGVINAVGLGRSRKSLLKPIMAKEDHGASLIDDGSPQCQGRQLKKPNGFTPLTNHSAALSGHLFTNAFIIAIKGILSGYEKTENNNIRVIN